MGTPFLSKPRSCKGLLSKHIPILPGTQLTFTLSPLARSRYGFRVRLTCDRNSSHSVVCRIWSWKGERGRDAAGGAPGLAPMTSPPPTLLSKGVSFSDNAHLLVVVKVELSTEVVMGNKVVLPVVDLPKLVLKGATIQVDPALLSNQRHELISALGQLQILPSLILAMSGVCRRDSHPSLPTTPPPSPQSHPGHEWSLQEGLTSISPYNPSPLSPVSSWP